MMKTYDELSPGDVIEWIGEPCRIEIESQRRGRNDVWVTLKYVVGLESHDRMMFCPPRTMKHRVLKAYAPEDLVIGLISALDTRGNQATVYRPLDGYYYI